MVFRRACIRSSQGVIPLADMFLKTTHPIPVKHLTCHIDYALQFDVATQNAFFEFLARATQLRHLHLFMYDVRPLPLPSDVEGLDEHWFGLLLQTVTLPDLQSITISLSRGDSPHLSILDHLPSSPITSFSLEIMDPESGFMTWDTLQQFLLSLSRFPHSATLQSISAPSLSPLSVRIATPASTQPQFPCVISLHLGMFWHMAPDLSVCFPAVKNLEVVPSAVTRSIMRSWGLHDWILQPQAVAALQRIAHTSTQFLDRRPAPSNSESSKSLDRVRGRPRDLQPHRILCPVRHLELLFPGQYEKRDVEFTAKILRVARPVAIQLDLHDANRQYLSDEMHEALAAAQGSLKELEIVLSILDTYQIAPGDLTLEDVVRLELLCVTTSSY